MAGVPAREFLWEEEAGVDFELGSLNLSPLKKRDRLARLVLQPEGLDGKILPAHGEIITSLSYLHRC